MQGQMFDLSRFRRCVWDGPFGLSFGFMNTTTSFNFPSVSPPYAIAVSNGVTPLNVTMYVPVPATGIMWCHELINLGTGAGTITIKGSSSGNPTVGSVAAGKRAEIVWNPTAATPDWVVFLSA